MKYSALSLPSDGCLAAFSFANLIIVCVWEGDDIVDEGNKLQELTEENC